MSYERRYKDKYFKKMWKKLVPKEGQADNLQGELLRQIAKLRREGQGNGNINWCEDFEFFCDFLRSTLCNSDVLTSEEKVIVSDGLERMRAAGRFAYKFNNGEISDEEFEEEFRLRDGLAYTDDYLYDFIFDAVGAFYEKYQTPIPYAANPDIFC